VLPSMTKGKIVGILLVVIDVNPSHGFWTAILIKLFGHEGK
jgi:predicted methyltransferase